MKDENNLRDMQSLLLKLNQLDCFKDIVSLIVEEPMYYHLFFPEKQSNYNITAISGFERLLQTEGANPDQQMTSCYTN